MAGDACHVEDERTAVFAALAPPSPTARNGIRHALRGRVELPHALEAGCWTGSVRAKQCQDNGDTSASRGKTHNPFNIAPCASLTIESRNPEAKIVCSAREVVVRNAFGRA